MPRHRNWLRLVHAQGVHTRSLRRLLDRYGDPDTLCGASAASLRAAGLDERAVAALLSPDEDALAADLRWLEGPDRHLIGLTDPRYPSLLAGIDDPPLALFVAGDPAVLALPQFAIVGSRNPTAGGAETAAAFARHLAECGLCIASGLASGIDGAAHRGALAAGGATVAVCGTGLGTVYPARHRELAGEIARGGALVSELPTRAPPRAGHFPRRNRIISGLSVGTLVVEAARRSGSLITAHLATEQGREVFAVPGSIHNPLARGCHLLIREGAKLVESADDILDELAALVGLQRADQTRSGPAPDEEPGIAQPAELDEDYRALLDALGYDPTSVDTLVDRTGLTADAVSSMLLILELQGNVVSVPGGRYVLAVEGEKQP